MTNKTNPFPTYYEEYIFKSRYAKWVESEGRRENWDETVSRLVNFYADRCTDLAPEFGGVKECLLTPDEIYELYTVIYNLEVMPSMRCMMTAGPALDRDHIAAYNCAYLPVDDPRAFDEAMYILMCGTGVGFSVEREYTDRLPDVPEELHESGTVIAVADSKTGWSKAFRSLVSLLYSGDISRWDVSLVRPAGARLKTFGGRASGPDPLVDLFNFTIETFKRAVGRKLTTLECHDLMCKIADIVVVGGVRRSAMISLSDVQDDRMREAKIGQWYTHHGHRRLSNNSAVYQKHRPDTSLFMKEWTSLYESKSGERGFFSRYACQAIAGRNGRRDPNYKFGTNPCSEIILRPHQFCNLSEVVVRHDDTVEDLRRKARVAAILGTIQSTFTDFRYLRKIWRTNCEEERLLGVSLTGLLDAPQLITPEILNEVKQVVIDTNKEWADRLGINQSTATTCVKPSGTVSQLVNSSSGLHSRFAKYYIRTVRGDIKDPLTEFLKNAGIPWETDVMNDRTVVFSFPVKVPEEALTRDDLTAIDNLELWKLVQDHWCEHKPSITVNVKEDEWMTVGSWVFDNFDSLSGVAFLPYDGGSYKQAPYQEITEDEFNTWVGRMPTTVDWTLLRDYETTDTTTGTQELACSSGVCEIVDIGGGIE